jgi:hypothetical protein
MIAISSWVASLLGLENSYADEGLLRSALADFNGHEALPLAGPDDLIEAILAPAFERAELIEIVANSPWRFVKLAVGNGNSCVLVELSREIDSTVPTAAIRAMIRAWLGDDEMRPDKLLSKGDGHALIAWEACTNAAVVNAKLCSSLAGIALPTGEDCPSLSLTKSTEIAVAASALVLKDAHIYQGILQEVLRHSSPALRFMYLYRLFERSYLINALEKLNSGFYDDPKGSIKTAEGTVSNELNSFIALVEGTAAMSIFEDIHDTFSRANSDKGNRFLISIHKAVSNDGNSYQERWKKGCALTYKMRCAIVHSGKKGPIYESFPDAAAGCGQISERLEQAAYCVLSIEMH